MNPLHFPLVRISVLVVAGVGAGHVIKLPLQLYPWELPAGFAALCFLYFISKYNPTKNILFGIGTCVIAFGLGLFCSVAHNPLLNNLHYLNLPKDSFSKQEYELVIREKLKSNAFNQRYICHVQRLNRQAANGKLLLNIRRAGNERHFPVGTQLLLKNNPVLHKPLMNPGQFDYGSYLRNKGIYAQCYIEEVDACIKSGLQNDIWYYSDAIRNRIIKNLRESSLNEKELQVLAALILGQQQEISPDIIRDYQYAGAVHILSVSGLHVGFLLLFVNYGIGLLPNNSNTRALKLILVILFLWSFAVIAGLSASVVRSVTMFSVVAVGMHLKRTTNILHTLVVSMLLILLCQPGFLFDVGFQLSYLALFFIIWVQPLLSQLWQPKFRILKYFWDILTVSFAAQIGTLPLSIYYFHQFPGLFFITNLLVIPLVSIIMALGALITIWAAFATVPHLLIMAVEESIWLLNSIIAKIASFESFLLKDIPLGIVVMWCSYLLIISLVLWLKKHNYPSTRNVLIAIVIFMASLLFSNWSVQSQNELIVFHTSKNTVIGDRTGRRLTLLCSTTAAASISGPYLKPYLIANSCATPKITKLANTAFVAGKKILRIDSLEILPKNSHPDILLLSQSPKINLERILREIRPEVIVADASNLRSYIKQWQKTCKNEKIPFHATAEKGFYRVTRNL